MVIGNREFVFTLDQETKEPTGFREAYRIESKFLVEEYMLLANILIGEHLYRYCWDKTLLRVHADVSADKKERLAEFFNKVGLGSLDLSNAKSLSKSLEVLRDQCLSDQASGRGDLSKFNVAVRKFVTCLMPAKYVQINQTTPEDYLHFGLNFPIYTHFTSPIRRYADLLVHRLITLTLQHGDKTRELIDLMNYTDYAD